MFSLFFLSIVLKNYENIQREKTTSMIDEYGKLRYTTMNLLIHNDSKISWVCWIRYTIIISNRLEKLFIFINHSYAIILSSSFSYNEKLY